jgi:hypothetical protein
MMRLIFGKIRDIMSNSKSMSSFQKGREEMR